MTAASNPAAELTEAERARISNLFGWVPDPEPLDQMLVAVACLKADAYEAGRLAAGGAATDDGLSEESIGDIAAFVRTFDTGEQAANALPVLLRVLRAPATDAAPASGEARS